jgi:predicted N-acetyltransferase YhbS
MSENYIVETLDPKDFDEWVEHCDSIFDIGAEYFRRHFMNDPHRDYNSVFIIKDDNKIISTVRVFHRQVYIGGKIYKMGGVGEVSTNENYRKLGLSYKLMAAATEYMKKNDFYLSMLGTDYYSHYEKHGFKKANSYPKQTNIGLIKINAEIRPLTSGHFDDMAVLYEKYCADLNCCMVRTKEYWQEWCAGEMNNEYYRAYGIFKENKLAGYVRCGNDYISEIAADKSDHESLVAIAMLAGRGSDGDKFYIPAFVETNHKVKEEIHEGTMICLYKPIEINGIVLQDTAQVAEYFNANGGIVQWGVDGF